MILLDLMHEIFNILAYVCARLLAIAAFPFQGSPVSPSKDSSIPSSRRFLPSCRNKMR